MSFGEAGWGDRPWMAMVSDGVKVVIPSRSGWANCCTLKKQQKTGPMLQLFQWNSYFHWDKRALVSRHLSRD